MIVALAAALIVTAAPAEKPKLAAPGLEALNLDEKTISFFSEHFATQFTFEGVNVITPSQIGAVIGLERQKQLMGCQDDSSCMAEIGDALGVDGILTGSIAKLDDVYQLNFKIVSPNDASALATYSRRASGGQKVLLNELDRAAKVMAKLMKEKLALRKKAGTVAASTTISTATETTTTTTTTAATSTPGAVHKATPVQDPVATPEEPARRRKNRFTLGIAAVNIISVPVEYERALGDRVSIAIGGNFSLPLLTMSAGFAAANLSGSLALRYYLSGTAPAGFWLGPEVFAGRDSYAGELTGVETYADGVATLGYSLIAPSGFTLSAGAGGGIRFYDGDFRGTGIGPKLTVHLNLGYAF